MLRNNQGGFSYEVRDVEENKEKIKTKRRRFKGNKRNNIIALVMIGMLFVSGSVGFMGGMLANSVTNKAKGVAGTDIPVQTVSRDNGSMSVSNVVKACRDSVVQITSTSSKRSDSGDMFGMFGLSGESGNSEAVGSGVIITTDGYIVTNNHVVDGFDTFKVALSDESEYDAKLIGKDAKTDLAVLKIEKNGLTASSFGKSSSLEVGDEVVAIGNPLGELTGTVTNGIVSALDRSVEIEGQSMKLIQTNASINEGNSGGGLFDKNGLLIGIVNAKTSGDSVEGLGFAIPIDTAKTVIEQIMDYGYVKGRVHMGLSFIDITDEYTAYRNGLSELGVYIYQVEDNSNAQKAGLEAGYLVKKVNGKNITSTSDIESILEGLKVGEKVTVTVKGNHGTKDFTFKLSEEVLNN